MDLFLFSFFIEWTI